MLRGLLSLEESKSAKVIKELECEVQRLLDEGLEDKKLIEDLRRELSNCSQEIQYLQDQLNLRNVEANCVAEHVHSLELKLIEVQKLNEELKFLRDELNASKSERLFLTQMLDKRDIELQKCSMYLDKLEGALSSTALESQCEVEAVKLDLMALENRFFDAEKLGKEAIQEKVRMESWIQEHERRLEYSNERISYLEEENKNLLEKLENSERNGRKVQDKIMEHIDGLMGKKAAVGICSQGQDIFEQTVQNKPECTLHGTVQACTCEDVLGPILFKLAAVTASDGSLKGEMEKMSHQIIESQLLVNQLKEELIEEKLKAKEEAEDLIQEMAELRYRITDMLEQECKRRACIEQASLQRIEELEAQVRRERRRFSIVNGQLSEVRKLVESGAVQGLHIGKEPFVVSEANANCKCKMCVVLRQTVNFSEEPIKEERYSDDGLNQATIGWHSD